MATSAEIQKFEKSSTGHVEYFIKVLYLGREWAIRRRYSDFLRLNGCLAKHGYHVSYSLPPKDFWKRYSKKFLKVRQQNLQRYLDNLLHGDIPYANSLIREFLDADYRRLVVIEETKTKSVLTAFRSETIVKRFCEESIKIPPPPDPEPMVEVSPSSGRRFTKISSSDKSLSFPKSENKNRTRFRNNSTSTFSTPERKFSLDFRRSRTNSNKSKSANIQLLKSMAKKSKYEKQVESVWDLYDELLGSIECDWIETNLPKVFRKKYSEIENSPSQSDLSNETDYIKHEFTANILNDLETINNEDKIIENKMKSFCIDPVNIIDILSQPVDKSLDILALQSILKEKLSLGDESINEIVTDIRT